MRFSTSAVVAFATTFAFVAAQDLSKVPSCALPCFATAVQGSGCSLADTKCQCTTGLQTIQSSLLQCAPARCSADDLTKVGQVSVDLCKAVGVTLSVPTVLPTSGASAATSGASANSSAKATASMSMSASKSSTPAQSTGAASAMIVNVGAVALGLAGAFAL